MLRRFTRPQKVKHDIFSARLKAKFAFQVEAVAGKQKAPAFLAQSPVRQESAHGVLADIGPSPTPLDPPQHELNTFSDEADEDVLVSPYSAEHLVGECTNNL